MGDACLIKALFSPGVVLYQCKIRTKQRTTTTTKKNTSLRSSAVTNERVKSPLTRQRVFTSNNLTVSVKNGERIDLAIEK